MTRKIVDRDFQIGMTAHETIPIDPRMARRITPILDSSSHAIQYHLPSHLQRPSLVGFVFRLPLLSLPISPIQSSP